MDCQLCAGNIVDDVIAIIDFLQPAVCSLQSAVCKCQTPIICQRRRNRCRRTRGHLQNCRKIHLRVRRHVITYTWREISAKLECWLCPDGRIKWCAYFHSESFRNFGTPVRRIHFFRALLPSFRQYDGVFVVSWSKSLLYSAFTNTLNAPISSK